MLKKAAALLLSLTMLLSVASVSAQVVTEANGRVTYTDDFNDKEAGKVNSNAGNAYTSDVFVPDSTTSRGYATLTAEAGPDNTMAMVFGPHADSRWIGATTENLTSSSKWYEFSYDLKITGTTTSESVYFMADYSSHRVFHLSGNKIQVASAANGREFVDSGMTLAQNTWYHVLCVIHGGKAYGWISDDAGNSVCSLQNGVEVTAFTGEKLLAFEMDSTASGALTLTLDNAKLVEYNPATVAPGVKSATITDGAEKVARNVALEFEFDQSVTLDESLEGVVSLGKVNSDDSITPVAGAAVSVLLGKRTVKITYTGLLERKTEYVVSLENLKNTSDLYCSKTYHFTTEDLHLWEPIDDVSISAPGVDTLTPITFTIADRYDYPSFDGAVLAIVYLDGKMVTYDMKNLSDASLGERTIGFALGTVPAGAEVCIVLLDCVNTPIPLAGGVTTN